LSVVGVAPLTLNAGAGEIHHPASPERHLCWKAMSLSKPPAQAHLHKIWQDNLHHPSIMQAYSLCQQAMCTAVALGDVDKTLRRYFQLDRSPARLSISASLLIADFQQVRWYPLIQRYRAGMPASGAMPLHSTPALKGDNCRLHINSLARRTRTAQRHLASCLFRVDDGLAQLNRKIRPHQITEQLARRISSVKVITRAGCR
jgi:hypothetical protein